MYQYVYFIGIGGIGMSALARYFKAQGCEVCGYDRTATPLTKNLCTEGIAVHYVDNTDAIPQHFKDERGATLVIYTPAVHGSQHSEFQWFAARNFRMMKRSEVLGMISQQKKTVAVAGTHGKTSVSTMIAHLLTASGVGCDAFLGGISKNYESNLLLTAGSRYVVTEADEYDRSFLRLYPYIAVVTAMDADHLDIYGTHAAMKEAFVQFVWQIAADGALIMKHGLSLPAPDGVSVYTYSLNNREADFYAENIRLDGDEYVFDMNLRGKTVRNLRSGIPGIVNVENFVAAIAAAYLAGAEMFDTASFCGVQRRFDYRVRSPKAVYIDDYAHHPEELRYTIESVRSLYPMRHLTGIFQPHLYTRTRDFADEFAQSLSLLDSVILLDIYPAREEPIEGVTSKIIWDKIILEDKCLCAKDDVISILRNRTPDVWITMGAGNIDTLVGEIEELLRGKIEEN